MKKSDKILAESAFKQMMKEEQSPNHNYYASELKKINITSQYHPNIKIISGEGGGATKNLNLNRESIPILIAWLKMVMKKQPNPESGV